MLHVHRPHLFSHEWVESHATLAGSAKRLFFSLCIGLALALVTLLANTLEPGISVPLQLGTDALASQSSSGSALYLPDQFYRQESQAPTAELPAQF